MPTYAYACTECDHRFDIVQSFHDDALTQCPECGGRLRKVFNSVGVVFKGSGFYKTDSRNSTSASTAAGSSTTKSGGDLTSGSSSSAASESSSASTSGSSSGGSSSTSTSSTGASSGGVSSTVSA